MRAKLKLEIKNIIFDQTKAEFAALARRNVDLESQIHCGVTYGHRFTLIRYTGRGYIFCCTNCDLEYFRADDSLTEKEAELVTIIFPKQKMKGKK